MPSRVGGGRPRKPATPRPRPASPPKRGPATLGERLLDFAQDNGVVDLKVTPSERQADEARGTPRLRSPAEAHAFVEARLASATAFLSRRKLPGVVVAKFVTSDLVDVRGKTVAEHAEWQFFLVPKPENPGRWREVRDGFIARTEAQSSYPGMLNATTLEDWVRAQGVDVRGMTEDNPLFLGRLQVTRSGTGLFTTVPEYADTGRKHLPATRVEAQVLCTPEKLHGAIDALYARFPGEYGEQGVCHQAAVVVGQALGVNARRHLEDKIAGFSVSSFLYGEDGR